MLEKAVTWIIIMIVIVFDPLAVIMLLAAQMTFGWKRDDSDEGKLIQDSDGTIIGIVPPTPTIQDLDTDVGEKPTEEEKEEFHEPEQVTPATALGGDITASEEITADNTTTVSELEKWNKMIEEAEREVAKSNESTIEERLATGETYINQDGKEVPLESAGTVFPESPVEGDLYTRTDFEPPREFAYNGSQWVDSSTYTSLFPTPDLPEDDQKKRLT
jgi:hypothetical protein